MIKMTIGSRIKEVRGNLSQKEFGERIGAAQSSVQSWENDEALPGSKFLEAMKKEFEVSIDWLLDGVPPKKRLKVEMERALDTALKGSPEQTASIQAVINTLLNFGKNNISEKYIEVANQIKEQCEALSKKLESMDNRLNSIEEKLENVQVATGTEKGLKKGAA